jgi:hypothetical protein
MIFKKGDLEKIFKSPFIIKLLLECGRRDSNPHASRHQILSLARLPISPRPLRLFLQEKRGVQIYSRFQFFKI